jgi:hypothetical protein
MVFPSIRCLTCKSRRVKVGTHITSSSSFARCNEMRLNISSVIHHGPPVSDVPKQVGIALGMMMSVIYPSKARMPLPAVSLDVRENVKIKSANHAAIGQYHIAHTFRLNFPRRFMLLNTGTKTWRRGRGTCLILDKNTAHALVTIGTMKSQGQAFALLFMHCHLPYMVERNARMRFFKMRRSSTREASFN